ncbi:hypothetical protein N2152v2_000493 [Parachlorella kessleri]
MRSGFNFDALKAAANSFVQSAASTAKDLSKAVAQEVVGAKCLLDYSLQGQVASAGPGCLWKVYRARAKKEGAPYPLVSAWILDKRSLQGDQHIGSGSGGGSSKRLEAFLEQCRRDVQHLARLKHPSIVRLVHPLEETRTQLVFITEPIFSSLEDALHGGHGLHAELAEERRSVALSELELKHGLLQVSEGLHFLHTEAGMVHKAVCPENILITRSGSWKLAGFGHAASLDYARDSGLRPYDYSDSSPSLLTQVAQPPLPYTAPELVAAGPSNLISSSADVFSLAAVAYEALAKQQLLPVGFSLAEYESRVASITMVELSGCPIGLQQVLRQMLSASPAARPPVITFSGSQYFQGDVMLRGLRFLDTMLQRDMLQKAAFLKDLPSLCALFDPRVLRLKVLPPLLQELRSEELQPLLLPIVLKLVECQDSTQFADDTLPTLRPLLSTAKGEALLLLTQQAGLLARVAPKGAGEALVPQLLVRAAEHGDARCHEEMLRQVSALADSLEYEPLKAQVLPAVLSLCLNTTSAAVRVGAFQALVRLVPRLDQAEGVGMLGATAQVTAVDKTPATTMCALALGEALARQWGPRLAAEKVLPILCPLLVVPSLNNQQFAAAVRTVKDLVGRIEKTRGGGTDGAGSPTAAGRQAAAAAASAGSTGAESTDWLATTSTLPPSYPHAKAKATALSGSAAGSSLRGGTGSPVATARRPGSSNVSSAGSQAGLSGPLFGTGVSAGTAEKGTAAARPELRSSSGSLGSGGSLSGTVGLGAAPVSQQRSPLGAAAATAATQGAGPVDPFAWPPPIHQQQQQQQRLGTGGMGTGPAMAGVPLSGGPPKGGAPMRTSTAASSDPFAGLDLTPQAAGSNAAGRAAGGASGGGMLGGVVDPFDALTLSGTGRGPSNQQQQQPVRQPQQGVFLVGFRAEDGETLRRWFQQMEPGFVVSHCPAAVLANQAATLRQALGLSGIPVAPAQPVSVAAAGTSDAAATPASKVLPPAASASAEGVKSAAASSHRADQVEIPASLPEEQQHELRLPEQAWEPTPAWVPPVVLFSGMAGEEIVGLIELWPQELGKCTSGLLMDQEATSFAAVSEGLLDKPLSRLVLDIARAKLQDVTSAPSGPSEAPVAAAGAPEAAGTPPAGDGGDSGVMETEDMPAEDESGLSSKVREYMLVNAAGEVESEALSLPILREKLRNRVREKQDKQAAGEASEGEVQKGKKAKKDKQLDPEDDRVRAAVLESKKQGRAKSTKSGGFGAAGGGRPRGFG